MGGGEARREGRAGRVSELVQVVSQGGAVGVLALVILLCYALVRKELPKLIQQIGANANALQNNATAMEGATNEMKQTVEKCHQLQGRLVRALENGTCPVGLNGGCSDRPRTPTAE